MADSESKKKKFVVEEVVGDEPVHSEELEKDAKEEKVEESSENTIKFDEKSEEKEEVASEPAPEENEAQAEVVNDDKFEEPTLDSASSETQTESTPEPMGTAEPTPQAESPKTNMKLVLILTAFIALILGGVAGGVLVFLSGNTSEKVAEASPTPLASIVPTSTPTPEVDKQSVTIAIQNGSGIAGEGGRMSEFLTDEGFKVGTVGNASSFDHEETVIQAKESVDSAFLASLKETLSTKYKMGTNTKLTSGTSDIVVIIGSEKAQ